MSDTALALPPPVGQLPPERYRYTLHREWLGAGRGRVCWVMLNPSTADDTHDDPTIRRCVRFSAAWGYDGLVVVNLFALRSTDPNVLLMDTDPGGPENDDAIRRAAASASLVVAAWGAHRAMRRGRRDQRMYDLISAPLHCLGTTRDGHPRHPLRLRADTQPVPLPRRVEAPW